MTPGRLIYLMGPSGSGKDSLLLAAAEPLLARGCRIARRVITRSAEARGEDAQSVTVEEFERLEQGGAFAMSWRANGLHYGIPLEIDTWLAGGHDVLVNGSRKYLPKARERYPYLVAVLLRVAPDVLRARLVARGRETPAQIEARLARNAHFAAGLPGPLVELDNSVSLDITVRNLLDLLDGPTAEAG
ncbi:phosphonate metabolism protein/1,5-bisphosphokinase (PRPP-forming) PhnN [Pseudomonas sp. ZM23]|uniref:Ribose 1,5-bisphosphate phosphokinase PhnN n=1 Tax=Pseudomonas triclosanedens TaxID=2961893 RepID=A0ABY7A2P7_9PSED|nr:phosphonate metabolism protein/1,5-bisphosphokinase (PRPP-forming) PhnN [Pseudomonas triclosanedens]MCP8464815.1 phosphonate metabolism protein/1,5-bisphosphokinase (PRPP-forming) PhnN [Pseudomonas triclosanedens]MCP8470472.1 phosphonate metabolism protein/1,5-bisphosphokinase (PRPP-forming) PhnN [Pseudomonas triclosanedens]MCP8476278.1 phosphonate metabolism protein/1,5-bisphosphokinase (PRPP-forming) PhnN [Pseudomonas triclosanedens]WAI51492.1 phosphonate metabolism protein/1,5-bisphosphok